MKVGEAGSSSWNGNSWKSSGSGAVVVAVTGEVLSIFVLSFPCRNDRCGALRAYCAAMKI